LALTVFRDINNTIKTLLKNQIPDLSNEEAIVFDSPGEMESSTTPKLSVFLYLITENAFLRNTEPSAVNLDQLRFPPVTLDLHYIFTPYAQTKETELILLESVIQTLNDTPVFTGSMLQGNLSTSGNEKIRITPKTLTIDELNKLWSIFPNKAYKLSLAYVMTPVLIQSAKLINVTRVITKEISFSKKEG
jgi:hypothetical protein